MADELEAPDEELFERIYRDEFDYVWRSLRRLGVTEGDLKDVAHDVFVVVYRKLGEYDRRRPLRCWLFGLAYHVAANARRRAAHRRDCARPDEAALAAPGPAADELLAERQARLLLREALEALDLERRALLVAHDVDELPAPEIAATLGVPLNTVYSRIRLARARLAEELRRLRRQRGESDAAG